MRDSPAYLLATAAAVYIRLAWIGVCVCSHRLAPIARFDVGAGIRGDETSWRPSASGIGALSVV